jgi:hypothetical protein
MAGIKTSCADQFQHQQTGLGGHSGNCHGLWYWQFALKVSMDKRARVYLGAHSKQRFSVVK